MSIDLFAPLGHHALGQSTYGTAPRAGAGFLLWYQTAVLSVALGLIYANLPIYGYILHPALLPKYMFFGIFFLITPLMLTNSRDLRAYLVSPFAVWATLLLLLNLLHLLDFDTSTDLGGMTLIDNQSGARRALVTTRAQYVLFALFLGFAVCATRGRAYLYALVGLMVLIPCAVMVDFARPGLLYPLDTSGAVLGRAAAMFINPNMAGEAILNVFLLGCAVTSMKWRMPLFLLAGAAILTTFSRSSIIAWLMILFILVHKRSLPKTAVLTTASVLCVGLLFLGSFEAYLHSRQDFEGAASNILSRLDFFSSFSFKDDSSEERADVIRSGWEMFLQNPVFGAGAGATLFWEHRGSVHNQLLLFAAEYGLVGIGLWVWLLIILLNGKFFQEKGLQLAMAFLFAFMSMFTHQMIDSASYWLATFALISVRKGNSDPARAV